MELQERPNEALYQIMLARYYSAGLGRFLRPDPLQFHNIVEQERFLADPQSWNKYTYALNNPLQFKDGTGRVIQYTEAYRNEIKTNPAFREAHQAALKNPEGARIHEKLGRSSTLFVFDVADSKTLRSIAVGAGIRLDGGHVGGVTDRSQFARKNEVTTTINKDPGMSDDTTLYHEKRHGENTIDNAKDPARMLLTDKLIDSELDAGIQLYNQFRTPGATNVGAGDPGHARRVLVDGVDTSDPYSGR